MPSNLFTEIGDFFRELRNSLSDGLLFLGGPFDIAVSILDIAITAFVIYFLLMILRDSRAWQLLRGIILIIIFAFFASAIGLNTIGFLLSRTIPILAIAIIIIFQPELRRTLETVGRSRLKHMNWSAIGDGASIHQLVESIVTACEAMSKTRTGALIIIERNTRLGEFEEQENAVRLDASVTSTLLQQIFYTGSPLHDGAVLVRDGRVAAARVHVPLSDVYHLRRDFGLRHRAAVGASELGDAVAVVVSEEKGTISIAFDGVLHVLGNADALRTQLHKLLGGTPEEDDRTFLGWISRIRSGEEPEADEPEEKAGAARSVFRRSAGYDADDGVSGTLPFRFRLKNRSKTRRNRRFGTTLSHRQRVFLAVFSIILAVFSWLYVQITVNPISTRTFSVPLTHRGVDTLEAHGLGVQSLPVPAVKITLHGRQRVLNDIDPNTIIAYIDLSGISEAGMKELPVSIEKETPWYVKTDYQYPTTVSVNIYSIEDQSKPPSS